MATIANITVNDGAPTPVAHVFVPIKSGLSAEWKRTGVAGQPAVAVESLKSSLKLPDSANGVNKISLDLSLPVLEQVAGGGQAGYVAPPSLAHIPRVQVTFFGHQRSTAEDRKNLRVMLIALLANAQVIDLVDNLTPPN